MKKKDNGLRELLKLLKNHPELIKELVLDSTNIQRLLKSKEARELALGADATEFLEYVAGPDDGYPIVQCIRKTTYLCAKGSKVVVSCGGGTQR
jgi:hypothetical protein